jgi:S-adenosylmethionine:tRNA-ribosyltransferase-isomerase (queuine synthetase)
MSKCIEALKRTASPAVASIGFQAKNTEQKKAALIVIGTITSGVKKNVKAISSAGLDAVLFRPSVKTDLSEVMDSIGSVPFGLYLDDTQKEYDLPDNQDFLVYSTKMPVSMLNNAKPGRYWRSILSWI